MTQATGLVILGSAGFLAVAATHRFVMRLPAAWRWMWSIGILSFFFLLRFLLRDHLEGIESYYFFAFFFGALLVSACIHYHRKEEE